MIRYGEKLLLFPSGEVIQCKQTPIPSTTSSIRSRRSERSLAGFTPRCRRSSSASGFPRAA